MDTSTATQTESPAGAVDPTAPGAKGLKPDAIGYMSNLVIAIASTAPAYSLAASLGFVTFYVGTKAPAVMWMFTPWNLEAGAPRRPPHFTP